MGGGHVVILERLPAVGHGSSARANGGVRAQFTTSANIAFSLHSIEQFERLREADGDDLGFRQVGYLLFTGDGRRLDALREAFDLQRSMGVATEWLSRADVMVRAPFLRADGLIGGTFHARDGVIDPHGVVSVLAGQARRRGVEVRTGCDVIGLKEEGSQFTITTTGGRVRANWVVNAAGADARSVGAMMGVDVPVDPVRRNLAFFPSAGGAPIPMCVDLDTGVLVRREGQGGFVVAYSNPNDPPSRETNVDPAFLQELAERVGNRFPFLADLRVDPARCWAGLYPETPDHHAIIGATASCPRFIQCVGFGGHGIMHAPAAGQAVAEVIVNGQCETFDLRPLRPSRFDEGDLVTEGAIF
jgi:sarcosine oxidase subunit beta